MEIFEGKFDARAAIEKTPFTKEPFQAFFTKWCQAHDSIIPRYLSRDDWDNRLSAQGVLKRLPDGSRELYLPKDLHLWEMVGIVETVDRDALSRLPEARQAKAAQELHELGWLFRNSGVYLAQRLNAIEQGKPLAQGLAQEFFTYGNSLITGTKAQKNVLLGQIAAVPLSPKETEDVDKWLAGEPLYTLLKTKVQKRVGLKPWLRRAATEEERKHTLNQFFRTLDKSFQLENRGHANPFFKKFKESIKSVSQNQALEAQRLDEATKNWQAYKDEYMALWQKDKLNEAEKTRLQELENTLFTYKPWRLPEPVHAAFKRKVGKRLGEQIGKPLTELESSIYRRGVEKLIAEMKEYVEGSERRLFDALAIPELKRELDQVRKSENLKAIGRKEREIADKIKGAVSSFPFQAGANNPSEMVANQYLNCVGASVLGGALLSEVGINYLVADVPLHSVLFIVTSDGKVIWQDMLNATQLNTELTADMCMGTRPDGSGLTVANIIAFAKHPSQGGLKFDMLRDRYRKVMKGFWRPGEGQHIMVLEPHLGPKIQMLSNLGRAFNNLGRHQEAIEVCRQAIAMEPKCLS